MRKININHEYKMSGSFSTVEYTGSDGNVRIATFSGSGHAGRAYDYGDFLEHMLEDIDSSPNYVESYS